MQKTDGYRYGYLTAGAGRPAFKRQTFMDRIRLRRRRRKRDDLTSAKGWWAI